eukprot:jgi/Hompol1/5155/HPOL_001127-RA
MDRHSSLGVRGPVDPRDLRDPMDVRDPRTLDYRYPPYSPQLSHPPRGYPRYPEDELYYLNQPEFREYGIPAPPAPPAHHLYPGYPPSHYPYTDARFHIDERAPPTLLPMGDLPAGPIGPAGGMSTGAPEVHGAMLHPVLDRKSQAAHTTGPLGIDPMADYDAYYHRMSPRPYERVLDVDAFQP